MDALGQDYRPRIKRILTSYKQSVGTMNGPGRDVDEIPTPSAYPEGPSAVCKSRPILSRTPFIDRNSEKRSQLTNVGFRVVPNLVSTGKVIEQPRSSRVESQTSGEGVGPLLRGGQLSVSVGAQSGQPIFAALNVRPESEIVETMLEGKCIAGFKVGGELRLCLPHIITSVLSELTAEQILSVCTALNMFLAPCTSVQLAALKHAGVLPADTAQCGLVTKTDAERMSNTLLHHSTDNIVGKKPIRDRTQSEFQVFHECFGGCHGLVSVDVYIAPSSRCIRCCVCGTTFSPEQFVGHCHEDRERRACHWGFDPTHWRSYIMVDDTGAGQQEERNRQEILLDDLKIKFAQTNISDKSPEERNDTFERPLKRIRLDDVQWEKPGAGTCSSVPPPSSPMSSSSSRMQSVNQYLDSLKKLNDSLRNNSSEALPPHLYTDNPVLVHCQQQQTHHLTATDMQAGDDSMVAPNISLDPEPYLKRRAQYPEPTDVENDATKHAAFTKLDEMKSASYTGGPNVLFPGRDDDVNEVDDDDDDANSLDTQSVMSDKLDDEESSGSRILSSDLDAKMDLIRSVLDGQVLTEEEKEACIQQFLSIQNKHVEMVESLQHTQRGHQREFGYTWSVITEKQAAGVEQQRKHEEQMSKIRQENAVKMREATLERYSLMKQIDTLSNGSSDLELVKMAAQYKEEADTLKSHLQQIEESNRKLKQEVQELRSALGQLDRTRHPSVASAQHGGPSSAVPRHLITAQQATTLADWYVPNTWLLSSSVKQE